eukprot:Phypoly_transcript_13357.p1 GENE.Phypoly_transcript_13357~~Phypoly_transcript_13357.p1  ORF type:complete len:301 (+),score=40.83 Phypoly_transcript_13357:162-1064(+)
MLVSRPLWLLPAFAFSAHTLLTSPSICNNGRVLSSSHTLPHLLQYSTFPTQPPSNNENNIIGSTGNLLRRRKTHPLLLSPSGSELKFLEYIGEELGFKSPSDWYRIKGNHFYKFNGHSLLKKYNYSPAEVVMGVFKDHLWLPWKFTKVSERFWDDKTNQKTFMKYLEVKLSFSKMEDWYQIEARHFIKNGGYTLLQRYMSPRLVVMELMSDHKWEVWLFKNVGLNFWNDLNNQCLFLENLAVKLGFVTMDDWYGIKGDNFIQHATIAVLPLLFLCVKISQKKVCQNGHFCGFILVYQSSI